MESLFLIKTSNCGVKLFKAVVNFIGDDFRVPFCLLPALLSWVGFWCCSWKIHNLYAILICFQIPFYSPIPVWRCPVPEENESSVFPFEQTKKD